MENDEQKPVDLSDTLSHSRPVMRPPATGAGTPEGVSAMAAFVIRLGLAKDSTRANYVLLVAAAAAILVSLLIFSSVGGDDQKIKAPPGNMLINDPAAPPRLSQPAL